LQSSLENPFQFGIYISLLMYNLFDIFMVMYFGNEIKVSRSRLSYCFFESNWIEQSALYKQCVIIIMEVLKQPQELVILKLYPLNLKTFSSVSYKIGFNILRIDILSLLVAKERDKQFINILTMPHIIEHGKKL